MSDAQSGHIKVRCSCGTKLRLPVAAVGRKAKCPKCEKVFKVPASGPIPAPAEAEANQPDEIGSALDELARMEQSAETVSAPGEKPRSASCPQCGTALPPGAVVCVSCGYHSGTGRTLKAASAKKAAIGGAVRRMARGAGTFGLGCILSGAGALIGAVVWCVVCVVTDLEIGWIALGLGALAGMGMRIGYRSENQWAGITAAGIAILGIFAAKLMVFGYLNYTELADAGRIISTFGDNQDSKQVRLAEHYAELTAQEQGLSYNDRARGRLYDTESSELDALSELELEEEIAELEAWEAGGKWDDPSYVRNFLVYSLVDEVIEERYPEQEYPEPTRGEWRQMYQDAAVEADAMTDERRLQRAKEIEHQRDREEKEQRLGWHDADRLEKKMGLRLGYEQTLALVKKQAALYRLSSDEELDAAIAELDTWEAGGKWDDPEWVTNDLVYRRIREEIDGDFRELSDHQWKKVHATAKAEVYAMSHEQRVAEAKKAEARDRERLAEIQDGFRDQMAKNIGTNVLGFFFKNYFGVMDIVFVILALVTAYRIGIGGSAD